MSFPRDKSSYEYAPELRESYFCIKMHNWWGTKCLSVLNQWIQEISVLWVVAAIRIDTQKTIGTGREDNRDRYLKRKSKLLLNYKFPDFKTFLGIESLGLLFLENLSVFLRSYLLYIMLWMGLNHFHFCTTSAYVKISKSSHNFSFMLKTLQGS